MLERLLFQKRQMDMSLEEIEDENGLDRSIRRSLTHQKSPGITFEDFLERYKDLPVQTVAFGYDENYLPLLFDLGEEHSEPLVVIGDPKSGKTRFLQTFLHLSMSFNSSEVLNFVVITSTPDEYEILEHLGNVSRHCLGVVSADDPEAAEWILRLAETAEERLSTLDLSPAILLVLDDLQFIQSLDTEVRLNLEWLLRNGPDGHVWVIGAISTSAALTMGRYISQFRTRILGKMPDRHAIRLGLYPGLKSHDLTAGQQFAVYLNQSWLPFWVPEKNFSDFELPEQEKTSDESKINQIDGDN